MSGNILGTIPCVQCFLVFIPPAVRPTLLRQMDKGSLMCAQIWVNVIHTKGVRHKQVCTRVDQEEQLPIQKQTVPHLFLSGDQTNVQGYIPTPDLKRGKL